MSDRYDNGYDAAKKFYTRKFNFRGELLLKIKREWDAPASADRREAITNGWPVLAMLLDEAAEQSGEMQGELR